MVSMVAAAMPRFIKRSLAEKASGEFKRQQGSPRDRCDGPGVRKKWG